MINLSFENPDSLLLALNDLLLNQTSEPSNLTRNEYASKKKKNTRIIELFSGNNFYISKYDLEEKKEKNFLNIF